MEDLNSNYQGNKTPSTTSQNYQQNYIQGEVITLTKLNFKRKQSFAGTAPQS